MARLPALLMAATLVAALALPALAQTTVPVNGKNVQPVQVVEPKIHDSDQPDQPTVTPVDQTFKGKDRDTLDATAGLADGEPVVGADPHPNPQGILSSPQGRKLRASARKLLQAVQTGLPQVFHTELNLGGDGTSAGNKDAGVAGNAFGHGVSDFPSGGTHIEPHGANVEPSVAGKQVDTTAAANPDGLGGEGPVTTVGKK